MKKSGWDHQCILKPSNKMSLEKSIYSLKVTSQILNNWKWENHLCIGKLWKKPSKWNTKSNSSINKMDNHEPHDGCNICYQSVTK